MICSDQKRRVKVISNKRTRIVAAVTAVSTEIERLMFNRLKRSRE